MTLSGDLLIRARSDALAEADSEAIAASIGGSLTYLLGDDEGRPEDHRDDRQRREQCRQHHRRVDLANSLATAESLAGSAAIAALTISGTAATVGDTGTPDNGRTMANATTAARLTSIRRRAHRRRRHASRRGRVAHRLDRARRWCVRPADRTGRGADDGTARRLGHECERRRGDGVHRRPGNLRVVGGRAWAVQRVRRRSRTQPCPGPPCRRPPSGAAAGSTLRVQRSPSARPSIGRGDRTHRQRGRQPQHRNCSRRGVVERRWVGSIRVRRRHRRCRPSERARRRHARRRDRALRALAQPVRRRRRSDRLSGHEGSTSATIGASASSTAPGVDVLVRRRTPERRRLRPAAPAASWRAALPLLVCQPSSAGRRRICRRAASAPRSHHSARSASKRSTSTAGSAETVGGSVARSRPGCSRQADAPPPAAHGRSIGANADIVSTGNVDRDARSVRAEADSDARSYGGGPVSIGASDADVHVSPTVVAYLAAGHP